MGKPNPLSYLITSHCTAVRDNINYTAGRAQIGVHMNQNKVNYVQIIQCNSRLICTHLGVIKNGQAN